MSERIVERQTQGRRLSDPRDTFDWSTPNLNVYARPTDPYVAPKVSSGTAQLAQALGLLQNSTIQYGQYKEKKNKEDYSEGQVSRAKGETKQEDATAAFIRGWEQLDGELQSQDFERKSAEFFEQHRDEDYETFQKNYNAFSKEYIAKLPTDDTIKGFIPKALEVEDRLLGTHHKYQQEKISQEKLTKVTSVMNTDIDNWIISTLGIKSMDEILTNDEAYLKFYANKEQFKQQFQEKCKEYLATAREKYKAFFNDKEVGSILYSLLKSKAQYYDMPELMAAMDNPSNKEGMSEKDALGVQDEVYQILERSSVDQSKRLSIIQAKTERQVDEYVNKRANYYYSSVALLDDNDIEGAKQLLLELNKDEVFLANGRWNEIYTSINKILESTGFPKESDEAVYYALDEKRWKRTLNYNDLVKNRESLSKSDYEGFRSFLEKERRQKEEDAEQRAAEARREARADARQARSDAKQSIWYDHKKEMSEHYSSLIDSIKKFNKFNMWMNPKETYQAQHYLGSLINEFTQKNGREPMGTEWKPIEEAFYAKFSPGISTGSQKKEKPQQQQKQQEKPKTAPAKKKQEESPVKVPKGYIDTGRIDPKTGKKVYKKPNGDYVVLGD